MKNFLKTLACMVLPLAISSCSFANGSGSSGYQVTDRDQAIAYAQQINNHEQPFGEVKAQYKYKISYTNSDTTKTGDTCQYNGTYKSYQGYWEMTSAPVQDEYLYNSFNALNTYFTFDRGVSIANQYSSSSVRYSIDSSAQKIKIEINQGTNNKVRLEYDATLYLRASLTMEGQNLGRQTVAINSRFSYSGVAEDDSPFNHDYNIFTSAYDNTFMVGNYNMIRFEYYLDGNYAGYVNFDYFFNEGIINSIEAHNCEYGWGGEDFYLAPQQVGVFEIGFGLFNGETIWFSFEAIPNYWDTEWLPVTTAISRGQPDNYTLYRTCVSVSGFLEGYGMPTEYGSYFVTDDYGNQFMMQYSSLRPVEEWIHYDAAGYFFYDYYSDFYNYAPLGTQYGLTYYPNTMQIGDVLEILYAVNANGISFAYIASAYMNNRMNEKHIHTGGDITAAFTHASANGEARYIYTGGRMTIKSYYGTYTNPSNYGNFVVTDYNGNEYTVYGSTMCESEFTAFTYNQLTDAFSFNNPRNFLQLDYWLGEYNGTPIYPKDLMPGDVLWMDFIIVNGRINGLINSVELCSRDPKPEPEMLSLSLHEIFERNDANATRLYSTYGYITGFSTYGMYLKENINDSTTYFIYNATFDNSSLVYNSSTGLYQFTGKTKFGENHGDLRIGDLVWMVTTRNDYQGQWELIGFITSFNDSGDCYSITSADSSTIELYPNTQVQLSYDCLPAESRLRANFSSENIAVASVDQNGLVTANGGIGTFTNINLTIDGMVRTWSIYIVEATEACYSLYADTDTININVGTLYALTYTCLPDNARSRATYSSDKPGIVDVNSEGYLTGMAAGTAYVTVTIDYKSWTWLVTVSEPNVYCQSISSDYSEVTIYIGERFNLLFSTYPANVTSPIYFNSYDTAIVTVDSNGVLTGIAPGQTSVYVTIDGIFFYWTVNVIGEQGTEYAKYINSPVSEYRMDVGQSYQLEFEVIPSDRAAYANFSSSDPAVVSIDSNGLMTALAAGTATITMDVDHVFHTWTVYVSEIVGCNTITSPTSSIQVSYVPNGDNYYQLEYTCYPSDAASRAIFTSSDESIAIVDQFGLVLAVGAGTAIITLTIDTISYSWEFTVFPTINSPETEIHLPVGGTYTISYTVDPGVPVGDVNVWSATESIVAVDGNGVVTAIAEGHGLIAITVHGSTFYWNFYVYPSDVTDPCMNISCDNPQISLGIGETYQLDFSCDPESAKVRAIYYNNNEDLITVDENGFVTAIASGDAVITILLDGMYCQIHIHIS